MKNAIIAVIATALVVAIPSTFAHGGGMKGGTQAGPGAMHGKGKAKGKGKGKGKGQGKGGPGRGGKGIKGGMPEEK